MPVTITPSETESKSSRDIGAGGGGFHHEGWGGSGPDRGGSRPFESSPNAYRLAMWLAMGSILMLFVALSSAYVIRQGGASDWRPLALPSLLLPNTLVLVASGIALELARRALRRGLSESFRIWISSSTLLGILFLGGQLWIWRALRSQGVYLNTNPHSSFFYLMTGTHGVHLLGGLLALCYVSVRAWSRRVPDDTRRQTVVDVTALYWHFMDALWIYLFLLLFIWR